MRGRRTQLVRAGQRRLLSVSGGRDLTIKQGAQVQAAGALNASAGRDLSVSGALASVRDLTWPPRVTRA